MTDSIWLTLPCGHLLHMGRPEPICLAINARHKATRRRESVVAAASMEMNERGVDYQPDQVWTGSARRKNRRRTGVIRS